MGYKVEIQSISRSFPDNRCDRCSSRAMLYRYIETLCLACGWRPGESTEDYMQRRQPRRSQLQPESAADYAWEQRMQGYTNIKPAEVERLSRKDKRERWSADGIDWDAVRLSPKVTPSYLDRIVARLIACGS